MDSWEFAKYLIDTVYGKWYITAFFLFLIFQREWDIGDKIYDSEIYINRSLEENERD